jgi:hypothetical protein
MRITLIAASAYSGINVDNSCSRLRLKGELYSYTNFYILKNNIYYFYTDIVQFFIYYFYVYTLYI